MGFLYVVFVGIPMSFFLMLIGCLACLTVIGIPFGLTCFALGHRVLYLH